MFVQVLEPLGSVWVAAAVALLPLGVLLVCLAGLRISAWLAVLLCAAVTVALAVVVWDAPLGKTLMAYGLGSLTGLWSVGWIVFWGLVIYNTMVTMGAFAALRDWLVMAAGPDVRVQVLVLAWAFGALLEGLVGFGYPWAVVAPILIGLGMSDLAALRTAALGNMAPVSNGALGAPIIGLAAVTGLPLLELSASIGKIVAVLAIAPPFLLIYLVSGREGLRTGWPLGVVAAAGFIAGQLPTSQFLGPYLPAVIGALTCLGSLLLFLRVWTPQPLPVGAPADLPSGDRHRELILAIQAGLVPIAILVAVVVAWTGPWSPLPRFVPFKLSVVASGSLGTPVAVTFSWAPFVAGTATLTAWLLITAYLRPSRRQLKRAFRSALSQMWGALLVAPLIFGLAAVFNYSGMGNTLASALPPSGRRSSCSPRSSGGSPSRCPVAPRRRTRCSVRSSCRWAGCSACPTCCSPRSTVSARRSASPSRRRPPASASPPPPRFAARATSSATTWPGRSRCSAMSCSSRCCSPCSCRTSWGDHTPR